MEISPRPCKELTLVIHLSSRQSDVEPVCIAYRYVSVLYHLGLKKAGDNKLGVHQMRQVAEGCNRRSDT